MRWALCTCLSREHLTGMIKHTHGGAREGSGRKPFPLMEMKSIKLTPEQWATATHLGHGNAAAGIRNALALASSSQEAQK